MVDATAGHEVLTFLNAYSGYNQILMHLEDQEKTTFMTDKGIYCYKVMPFGLKNARATYCYTQKMHVAMPVRCQRDSARTTDDRTFED